MRGHNTVEQNWMPDSWLILSPVAAPACGVHKNCKITFTPDGGAINVAKRGNKSESLPLSWTALQDNQSVHYRCRIPH